MKIQQNKVVTTKVTTRYTITATDLRQVLGLPPTAKIIFEVPGGGDYSGADLDLEDYPLIAIAVDIKEETN